jgi:hypothetical protein
VFLELEEAPKGAIQTALPSNPQAAVTTRALAVKIAISIRNLINFFIGIFHFPFKFSVSLLIFFYIYR